MCQGTLKADTPSRIVRRISKDTRTLVSGDLYLALRGENHDGNIYAKDAATRGAAGAILDTIPPDLPETFPVIVVEDTLVALHRLAAAWRDRLALKVACITGSSGKTSTKEFTAAVLSVRYRVVKTEGNLNNHIGLPLSILSASISDDAAVWEIGTNHPGEIAPLARLARPDLAIITNIGVAHIEHMGSREAIAREKGALAEAVGHRGAVILPAEDDFSSQIADRTSARVVRAGLSSGKLTASDIEMSAVSATIPAPGEHMVRNALLAVAAGIEFGLKLEECAEGLAATRLTEGRLSHRILRGVTVLDDTYNANPDSMDAALKTLGDLPATGRRIAVLGRMGELGDHATAGYERVGRKAARVVDALIAVGIETTPLSDTARAAGLKEVHTTRDTGEAAGVLRNLAREGDLVLVKGSRAARMERVIENF
jgi:UDP-N-acetylmuramoyl-tripeptide--D-alanyl-D-alanine ligase